MERQKTLAERYSEIDKNDAENVLAFLYKEETKKYDEKDALDILELFLFSCVYAKETPPSIKKRLKVRMGDKIPGILKLADRATKIVEEYQSIMDYAEATVTNRDENFIAVHDTVYQMIADMIQDGYTCYLESYNNDEMKQPAHHNVYLTNLKEIEKYYLKWLRVLLDTQMDGLPMTIRFIKPVKKGEETENPHYTFRKTRDGNFEIED